MKTIVMIVLGAFLCGCSAQTGLRIDSPFKMSDEEFNQRVAALVNPPLSQLQRKVDELKASKEDTK